MTTPTNAFGNTRPSEVTVTFFNRTNDPMDHPIDDPLNPSSNAPQRKYNYPLGDGYLIDNTSIPRKGYGCSDIFGLLSAPSSQKVFTLIQSQLLQPQFDKIWRNWLACLPRTCDKPAMLYDSLQHIMFSKPIFKATAKELQDLWPKTERKYEGIELETDRPISIYLQVCPLPSHTHPINGPRVRFSRIVIQVGLTLVYHHADVVEARGNTWKEVSIACGVYLDKTDTGMDHHFGENATDVSDILSLASNETPNTDLGSISSSLPSNPTDSPAERSCLSTILQSVAEISSPPSLLADFNV